MFSVEASTLTILGTIVGTVAALTWWLSSQFEGIKRLMFDKIDNLHKILMEKIEYHERHDDQRFQNVHEDIWSIKVRNAAVDGLSPKKSLNSDYISNTTTI